MSSLQGGWIVDREDAVEVHVVVDERSHRPRERSIPLRFHDGVRRRGRDEPSLDPDREDRDATAGAPGELRSDIPMPGMPENPPLAARGVTPEERRVPTGGGVNPEPVFVDAQSLRISGRDQSGRSWGARLYGPNAQGQGWAPSERDILGEDQMAPPVLTTSDSVRDSHPQMLGQFQRYLDQHYARR